MDRDVIASGLLRELWRSYDHGGHSGRSVRAQLLETDWHFSNPLLENVAGNFLEFVWRKEVYAPRHALLHARSPDVPNGADLRRGNRLLMLAGMMREYGDYDEANPPYERKLFNCAAMYAGLPTDGGVYLRAIADMEPYDLVVLLRAQDPQHKQWLEEFGLVKQSPDT